MKNKSFGILKLLTYLNDVNNEVKGFAAEITENGFVLTVIIHRHLPLEGVIKLDPTFSFEHDVRVEEALDPILATLKVRRPK